MAAILVLDDEVLITMMLKDWLDELGHETVGPAASNEEALALVADGGVEAAILDVSVGGARSYSVADALRAKGIPFAFITGHGAGSVTGAHDAAPVLAKPFDFAAVESVVAALLAAR
jgi:CheY-like chemotaxis protein